MTTKHFIFSIIFLGYGVFAYNRKGVSYTIPTLIKDGMPNDQLGLILSAQNGAYAISKFMGGVASDRLSSRILFSLGLAASGLTAFLFAASNSVPLYTLAWFLNGLAQGLGWPAIAKLLKEWFKPVELGLWWSAASASANVSGVFGPVLAAALIQSFGWRWSVIIAGLMSLVAAAVVYCFIEDQPKSKQPSKSNSKSNAESNSKNTSKAGQKMGPIPFKEAMRMLLSRPIVWVISLAYLSASCVKTGVGDWAQMYITSDLKLPLEVATSFLGYFEFGGFCGGILAGYVSDYMMREYKFSRVKVALFFALLTGASLFLLTRGVSQFIAIALGTSIYGQIALLGIAATESVASEMSGTSHAIAALAANVGSVLAGLPFATLALYQSWHSVFQVLFLLNMSSAMIMMSTFVMRYQ